MKLFEFVITSIMQMIALGILAALAGFIFSKARTFKGRWDTAVEVGIYGFFILPFVILPIKFVYNLIF